MYIENPNLPKKQIKAALIDYRAALAESALKDIGITVFKTPEINIAYPSISGHPDIMFHHCGRNLLVVSPEVFSYYKMIFPDADIIKGDSYVKNTYPSDVAYNVARVGNCVFHNFRYTDKVLYEYFLNKKIKLIQTKQGYSKCSVCIVSDDAIITSDKSIHKSAIENDMDALLISEGYIKLKDFQYGFIGGASGLISSNVLCFNGNIKNHPDYNNISAFCRNHHVKPYSLHNGELEDIGSIIPLY